MLTIDNNKIRLTRGDTMLVKIALTDENGDPYVPGEGDSIVFRVKQDTSKEGVLIEKLIDPNDLVLRLDESDTMDLPFGKYYYEVEVITADDSHFTVIEKTEFKITIELEDHDE